MILYGPPGCGKDTITTCLHKLDPVFTHFRRIKVGDGRTEGYRMRSPEELSAQKQRGEIIWENAQYGSVYAVDRPALLALLRASIPVIHLGQTTAIPTVVQAVVQSRWTIVELRCNRVEAYARLQQRDPASVDERMAVWGQTPHLQHSDLTLDTTHLSPTQAAQAIWHCVLSGSESGRAVDS